MASASTRHIVDVQFVHDFLAMFLDGLDAEAKLARDLFVGVAFGDKLQHFRFTGRQMDTAFLLGSAKRAPVMVQEALVMDGLKNALPWLASADSDQQIFAAVCFSR